MAEFSKTWSAEVLAGPPMIAPARQFVYPQNIVGEEDALARGALVLMVKAFPGKTGGGGSFLATCALGFKDPSMPTGVFGCPRAEEMCAVAGGYAYLIDTSAPERVTLLAMKPVVEVLPAVEAGLLLFVGFQTVVAWGVDGMGWETRKLSWEGVRVTAVEGVELKGFGWDMRTDKEVEFVVDLRTGVVVGGAF